MGVKHFRSLQFWWGCLILCLLSCEIEPPSTTINYGIGRYVDPFIGTADHGHVYPGATVPFGAVQLSPDNGTQGWDWCSGYNYADSTIVGFSHTHLSGTGIGDLCDLLIMPASKPIDLTREYDDIKSSEVTSTFSHRNESAKPGFYRVKLDNGVTVELTASERVGMHRYSFEPGQDHSVVLDLGYHINWDRPQSTLLAMESDTLYVGHRFSTGWAKDHRVHFAMSFSEAPSSVEVLDSTTLLDGLPQEGEKLRARFSFDTTRVVMIKVGLSSASIEGAIAALGEIPHWDFDAVHQAAAQKWHDALSKIEVYTLDETLKKVFYTALYRTHLAPVLFEDALGQYKGADGEIHTASDYTRYDIFSLWDTFRAAHPLFTITNPHRVNDFIKSLLAHYEEYGQLPVWSLLGNETGTMTGYHAIPVIADAILKGHRDFDVEKAYGAMKVSAMQDINGTDYYRQYGYIPYELLGESVTRTYEYAYDDWCIAQVAILLGKRDDYDYFMKRSNYFKNLFDTETKFMRAKLKNGKWKTPFDPLLSDHNFDVAEYTEGNAWQHSWFAPHDVRALIDLYGGSESFKEKLDTLFTLEEAVRGDNVSADISGLIGQYAHGNEPSHHIPYLYNYASNAWRSQEVLRSIMKTMYTDAPSGLCGNEDCGQMSAWFVFSAMGFYPVNPAEGVYVIGTPLFNRVDIHLDDGKTFRIKGRFLTESNMYIQAATLNEAPLDRSYIRHFEIIEGGELILQMGAEPNYLHWIEETAFPPSASDPEIE